MKKYLLLAILALGTFTQHAHALAVFDGSNLAQNIVAAREAITQTQQQIQQLQTQLNQYKRMIQDATNPGNWNWGDIQDTLNQLKYTMGSINTISSQAGGINSYLEVYGSYDKYTDGSLYGSQNPQKLYQGDAEGSKFQKQSADDLLLLIKQQQEQMQSYSNDLDRLKGEASGAQGQQEAIQRGNELATMQIQLLSQIHLLLMAQNTMLAAQAETETNREAQQRVGTAIKMGETSFTRKETAKGGKSFTPYK